MAVSPYVRRLRLAEEMLDVRQQAGYKTEDLSRETEVQRQKISHIETAKNRVDPRVIHRILTHLNVRPDRLNKVMELAEQAATPGWWERYDDEMGPRQARTADLEQGAIKIFQYQPCLVPGLLQTRRFAAVRAEADRPASSRRFSKARMLEARQQRQAILDSPRATPLEVIIDEGVLLRRSAPPDVMHEQLEHLIGAALNIRSVSVRVLPFSAGLNEHAQVRTAFSRYTFADPEDPVVAVVDTNVVDLLFHDHEEDGREKVTVYTGLADDLRQAALSPAESIDCLTAAAEAFLSRR
ncbi:helix-turn-helix domain-containing protein [Winogradskya humida]|uniref:Transcriptional regulator n=1 Tax=Winogradskya humida TaxID=113566 RepID=A0ABQ4A1Q0_9ACTN|nr:helix-turn-helix transcriptional regulator [Actinoplanes humidus]GIE24785.1 transcriptional regulator [Actinoplanes humidus]